MALLVVAIAWLWPAVSFAVQPLLIDDSYTESAGVGVNQVHGKRATIHVSSRFTGFLWFDLSTLPAGTTSANIEKVTLSLFVTRSSVRAPGSFDIRLVTGPWNEST